MINNVNNQEDKIFYVPGDLVMMKQDIPNKPKMVVVRIERSIMKTNDGQGYLKGVRCRWYSDDKKLQEAVYSTKDLIKV